MRLFRHYPGKNFLYLLKHRYRYWYHGGARGVFVRHYQRNKWGNRESVSGSGSTIEATENIRRKIHGLISTLDIKRVLDAPCGDYNWFRLIPRDRDVEYVGGDIVGPLIRKNRTEYENANTRFIELDLISDELPEADLWICRDCFIHLSIENIFSVLQNFLKSGTRYVLTTTYPDCSHNQNIPTGATRPLNLRIAPFSFCEPVQSIDDSVGGHHRTLSLWTRDQLAEALSRYT